MTVGGEEGFVYDPQAEVRKAASARVRPLRSKNYIAPKTEPTTRRELRCEMEQRSGSLNGRGFREKREHFMVFWLTLAWL